MPTESLKRVVFMGSPDFATNALQALHAHSIQQSNHQGSGLYDLVQVWTQPDRPFGRGRKLQPCAVKAKALALGLEVHSPTRMKADETAQLLADAKPDIAVVAAYGRILPQHLLDIPTHGCINIHASLLPKHRGAAPIQQALVDGDKETGVCIMRMEAGLDTGPVYARKSTPIQDQDTAQSLSQRLADIGAELLLQTLPSIFSGRAQAIEQNHSGASYAAKLHKSDGALKFTEDVRVCERQVRAMWPWPVAFWHSGDIRIQILNAKVAHLECAHPVGTLFTNQGRLFIQCQNGHLELLQIKPAGKKAMPAQQWAQNITQPIFAESIA